MLSFFFNTPLDFPLRNSDFAPDIVFIELLCCKVALEFGQRLSGFHGCVEMPLVPLKREQFFIDHEIQVPMP